MASDVLPHHYGVIGVESLWGVTYPASLPCLSIEAPSPTPPSSRPGPAGRKPGEGRRRSGAGGSPDRVCRGGIFMAGKIAGYFVDGYSHSIPADSRSQIWLASPVFWVRRGVRLASDESKPPGTSPGHFVDRPTLPTAYRVSERERFFKIIRLPSPAASSMTVLAVSGMVAEESHDPWRTQNGSGSDEGLADNASGRIAASSNAGSTRSFMVRWAGGKILSGKLAGNASRGGVTDLAFWLAVFLLGCCAGKFLRR